MNLCLDIVLFNVFKYLALSEFISDKFIVQYSVML